MNDDSELPALPDPPSVDRSSVVVRLAGIGGTGVVTAAQILGTAAMLAGFHVDGLDQTGLSQKAGPVVSDLSLTAADQPRRTNLVGRGQADLLLAFDLLTAASDAAVGAAAHRHTALVASLSMTPTGRQVSRPDLPVADADDLMLRLAGHVDPLRTVAVDAAHAAEELVGSRAAANILLLGTAVQFGALPIAVEAVEQAIRLNGVAVERNLAAFEWGRRWVVHPHLVERALGRHTTSALRFDPPELPDSLGRRVERLDTAESIRERVRMLAADLVDYQSVAYAERFLALVERAADVHDDGFIDNVARMFHKLLAYKDEYEVARLMGSSDGLAPAVELAGGAIDRISWHLHPPIARALGMDSKLRFGPRTRPIITALQRGKRLRGTRFDPFGRTTLRRLERALPTEYQSAIGRVVRAVATGDLTVGQASEIAALPDQVRGYEDLKVRRAGEYRSQLAAALTSVP